MRQDVVRLRAAGLDQHVAHGLLEAQVGPAAAVQVADLPAPDPELDAAEAVLVRGDALPGRDLGRDPPRVILHPCRSTSVSATCRGSGTSCTATTAPCSPRR